MRVITVRPYPNLRDKMLRTLWLIAWALLYRPSPTPFFRWRRLLLRLFGAEVGDEAHPYPSARVWAPWNLVMKAGSCLASGVDCYCVDKIVIGRDAVVSQRAFLCTASHDFRGTDFALTAAPIEIGDNAWVAAEAYIGPGVTLGTGSVAGARAVVVRDVAPGAIVVGNPARVVESKEKESTTTVVRMQNLQTK
jgi:putative colanic acid biosynthesis acetyltransferase WcaF